MQMAQHCSDSSLAMSQAIFRLPQGRAYHGTSLKNIYKKINIYIVLIYSSVGEGVLEKKITNRTCPFSVAFFLLLLPSTSFNNS